MFASNAIKQQHYRARIKAGLKFWGFYAEQGLVQHVLYAVSDKLPMIAGDHSYATLKRVLAGHLLNQWLEAWRQEWLECEGEKPRMSQLPPCADPSTALWFWSV